MAQDQVELGTRFSESLVATIGSFALSEPLSGVELTPNQSIFDERCWTRMAFLVLNRDPFQSLPVLEVLTRSMLRCRGIIPVDNLTRKVSSGCRSCEATGFQMTSP